jgi:TetR/AcrR family transcriptional regulator, repressor of fatR-cypB operon
LSYRNKKAGFKKIGDEHRFIYFCSLKRKDENKVGQIFSATLKLVVDMGMAGITMRQIASKAGMATGTLYIYFKDKEELINQLYEDCRTSSVNAYFNGYDAAKPFKTGFRIIWKNILSHKINNFDAAVFMEQCYHSPFIPETSKEMSRHLLKPLYRLMDRGKEEMIIKDVDTLLLLIFMIGNITEVIKYVKYNNKKVSEDIIENAFSICWDGLKK